MNTPENTPIRSQKTQGRILVPNTQVPEHRKPNRISRNKEITVIPDTPDRDPDSQQDFENFVIDRVLDTPSPASQTPVGARGRQPFNFSLSFSLNDTPEDDDGTPSKLEMESTKVKSNRRKSYLIDSKSKIKRRSSTKQLLRQLDSRPIRRTPDLINMFEETNGFETTTRSGKQTGNDFSFHSPERSPQMSQTNHRTINMIADSPGPVASVLFPKNEPPVKRRDKIFKEPEVQKPEPEVQSEKGTQPEVKEITEKTSRIALKSRRRTRLSLEACSTPPSVNYGHVGLKDSSYVLVNFNENERKELNSAIYKLSNGCKNFKLVQNAKCHTTHCFIKGKSKTIQIYKSLAYGAYILTAEYIKDSLAAGQWVSSSSGVVLV